MRVVGIGIILSHLCNSGTDTVHQFVNVSAVLAIHIMLIAG